MKKKILLMVLVVFCLGPSLMKLQADDPCHYTTEGTDFWFGFMQNTSPSFKHNLEVTITSRLGAQITLTHGPNDVLIGNYTINPNSSVTIPVDYKILEPLGSETKENKGIHLVSSTNPVNVYALNYTVHATDVAVIHPTASLGKEYYAMCYTPHQANNPDSNSEFLVVASQDNTTIHITPSVDTYLGKMAKTTFSIQLNKGQTYQVQSMKTIVPGQGDLTGSHIISDKPIAFYSGSKEAAVPYGFGPWNHLYEQIPPINTWGREFYVVPQLRKGNTYRILAAEDGTTVKIEGTNTVRTINRGEFAEFELTSTQASRIISTKSVLLAQFCRSKAVDGDTVSQVFADTQPSMMIISPVRQKINDVTFVAYECPKFPEIPEIPEIQSSFYVNVITYTSEIGNITLDGNNLNYDFSPFPNSVYSYAQVPISAGPHRLLNANEDGGFLAFVYCSTDHALQPIGLKFGFSYGYGVGFNFDFEIEIVGNWTTSTPVVCHGKAIKLSVEDNFDTYLWSTGETGTSIMVSEEKQYWVRGTTNSGCIKTDTVYVKARDPKIDLGRDAISCGPKILDAGPLFKTYLWQDGSTSQTFTVNQSGDYYVTGINDLGCQASDTIHVDVFQVPRVKMLGEHLHCGVFTSDLKVEITDAAENLWNYPGAAQWTVEPAVGIQFENRQLKGVTLKATIPGLYTINYILTTTDGCKIVASFEVGFFEIPLSTFEVISPGSTDRCASYERIVKYTGKSGPGAKYTWDFGGLMVLDTIGPNHFKISIGANKGNRTISLLVEEHGCTSELTTTSIGVIPTFSYGADKVHGCDAMCVQFTSEVTIEDEVTYQWTFGDGKVSSEPNPLHCYTDTGKYDVSLMLTNVIDGCRNGWTEKKMIKIYKTPEAKLSADPGACYGDTVSFEYLDKTDISNCKWFENGNELILDENTWATYLLKNEISEVGFIVEENGCSCDTFKVEVKRKPNFGFESIETEWCLPVTSKLKAIAYDPNLQYFWSVDTLSEVTGDSLVHLFSTPGSYTVTLKAYSALTGCSDQITKTNFIQVYPLPKLAFSQNYRIATLEHPEIQFTNQTQGAGSYFWDFGDGQTSTEKDPLHKYTEIGDYQVVLLATTDFGCLDTIGSRVQIFPFSFNTPNAFRPDSEIPGNRIFLPVQEGINADKYHFQVFSRLGSSVFETQNPESGWDGKSSDGSVLGPRVYVWIIKFMDVQGLQHQQKGTVMLVR